MKFMKRIIALFLLLTIFAPISGSFAAEKFTVLLDWYVNPDHGPLFVAQEQGFFDAVGLDVELLAPANPNDPPKLVAAEQASVAISYQPQLHLHVDQGLPLVRIGTLVATPLNCIVVLAESNIQKISDLKGRKIGYSVAGFEDALLGSVLETHGLSLNDVVLININFSLSPALMSEQVDAVIGAFRNFELNQMNIHGVPGRAFFLEEEGIPAYDELIIVAHQKHIHDPKMRHFIDALERGVQFMINHPQQAWKNFINHDRSLDNELNRRAWRDTLARFALRPGALDRTRYQRFAEFLFTRQLIKEIPPLNQYAIELN